MSLLKPPYENELVASSYMLLMTQFFQPDEGLLEVELNAFRNHCLLLTPDVSIEGKHNQA